MNTKTKIVIKTLLKYAIIGPFLGGVLAITILSILDLRLDPEFAVLALAISYGCGLLPALLTGTYVAVKAIKIRPICLRNYYALAAFFSLFLNPFFLLQAGSQLQTPHVNTDIVFTIFLPLVSGLAAAYLLLRLVRKHLAATPFALRFDKSSPALNEA